MGKILIIGLDGATFDLIIPWVNSGALPNIARLLREGASGRLKSVVPPMSPPAWNSFMTGKNAGKHGIFDFTERKSESYEARFINASFRKSPTIWQYLSQAGKKVASISVPFTYPPEKVNGLMISGMDAPGVAGMVDKSATYPPELCDEIRSIMGDYPMGPNLFAYSEPEEMINATIRTMEKKAATALYLYKKESWDCFIFVLGETDAASHRFWKYHDPLSPLQNGVLYSEKVAKGLFTVYKKADEILGSFLASMPPDTTLILMSDHGQGGNSDKAVYLNKWLEGHSLLKFKGSIGFIITGLEAAKQVGLKIIPPRIKRLVYRLTDIPNAIESMVRFSALDWKLTKAYSEETPYFPSIWINMKGREPQGIVDKSEYDSVCENIKNKLLQWEDPYTGQKMIKYVYRRNELYAGEHTDKAADLIIEWNIDNGYSYNFRRSNGRSKLSVSRLNIEEKKKVKSGDHRDYGIFVAKGNDIKRTMQINGAELIDLAPTILYLLDIPVPADMDGKVLMQIFKEGHISSHPIKYDNNGSGFEVKQTEPHHSYSKDEEEVLKERLQGLGYIE